MFLAEAAFVVLGACGSRAALRVNRPEDRDHCVWASTYGEGTPFQVSVSGSLEDFMQIDVGAVPGVHAVAVTRKGSAFYFDVVLDDLEFSTYKLFSDKEMQLLDEFPQYDFYFNVSPLAAFSSPAVDAA